MKRYVDSSKSKKASKSTKASNSMKPQTATNGLKRPLPSTAAVEDAKRLNLDSSATAINIKKEDSIVKSEPKSDTSDNNLALTANAANAAHTPPVSAGSALANSEVKQESSEANLNHSNNDVSLNDFVNDEVFDLENTDFQVCNFRGLHF